MKYKIDPPIIPFGPFFIRMERGCEYVDQFHNASIRVITKDWNPDSLTRKHRIEQTHSMVFETRISVDAYGVPEELATQIEANKRFKAMLFGPFQMHLHAAKQAVHDRKADKAMAILEALADAIEGL